MFGGKSNGALPSPKSAHESLVRQCGLDDGCVSQVESNFEYCFGRSTLIDFRRKTATLDRGLLRECVMEKRVGQLVIASQTE
jgi:hypothetical protein